MKTIKNYIDGSIVGLSDKYQSVYDPSKGEEIGKVILSNKNQIKSLQNKNRILTEELNDLRNVAIDEGIYESDDGDY